MLKLIKRNNRFETISSMDEDFDTFEDELVMVFENGVINKEWKFEEIRERAKLTMEDLCNLDELKLAYL